MRRASMQLPGAGCWEIYLLCRFPAVCSGYLCHLVAVLVGQSKLPRTLDEELSFGSCEGGVSSALRWHDAFDLRREREEVSADAASGNMGVWRLTSKRISSASSLFSLLCSCCRLMAFSFRAVLGRTASCAALLARSPRRVSELMSSVASSMSKLSMLDTLWLSCLAPEVGSMEELVSAGHGLSSCKWNS